MAGVIRPSPIFLTLTAHRVSGAQFCRYSGRMIESELKVVLRKAKAADSEALAKVFADSWRQAYRGIIPHSHLECLIRRRGVQWWKEAVRTEGHLVVLEAAGVIVAGSNAAAARLAASAVRKPL